MCQSLELNRNVERGNIDRSRSSTINHDDVDVRIGEREGVCSHLNYTTYFQTKYEYNYMDMYGQKLSPITLSRYFQFSSRCALRYARTADPQATPSTAAEIIPPAYPAPSPHGNRHS